jgi:hypothetical protein
MFRNTIKNVNYLPILLHEMDFEDVHRLLDLHRDISCNSINKDIRSCRNALLRASVVLIVARIEYFVEELFEWAAKKIFDNLSKEEIIEYYKISSKRFNNPTSDNINKLFLEIGIHKVMNKICTDSSENKILRKTLDDLINKRHEIAHGKIGGATRSSRKFSATATQVKSWNKFAIKFMYQIENTVSNILLNEKGIPLDKVKQL